MSAAPPRPRPGRIDPVLLEEFPQLRLVEVAVDAAPGRSTRGMRQRLRALSDRFSGAQAVALRTEPIPHAYRVFHRHVGLDPDEHRTPIEAAVLERLHHGGFRARGRVEDALLCALVETGVPVWALDDEAVEGTLALRQAAAGERLGEGELANDVPRGRLVVADDGGPVAVLFGDAAERVRVGRRTRRLRLYSVAVAGVPAIHVEEALDVCLEGLAQG